MNIYVLPTTPGRPPMAMLFEFVGETPEGDPIAAGVEACWSPDNGTWTVEGTPLSDEVAEAITEHARSLGVDL